MPSNSKKKRRAALEKLQAAAEQVGKVAEEEKAVEGSKEEAEARTRAQKDATDMSAEEEDDVVEVAKGPRVAVRPAGMTGVECLSGEKVSRATAATLKAEGVVAQHLRVGNNLTGLMIYECKEEEPSEEDRRIINSMAHIYLSLDDMQSVAVVRNDTSVLKLLADAQALDVYMKEKDIGTMSIGVDLRVSKYRVDKAMERFAVGWSLDVSTLTAVVERAVKDKIELHCFKLSKGPLGQSTLRVIGEGAVAYPVTTMGLSCRLRVLVGGIADWELEDESEAASRWLVKVLGVSAITDVRGDGL